MGNMQGTSHRRRAWIESSDVTEPIRLMSMDMIEEIGALYTMRVLVSSDSPRMALDHLVAARFRVVVQTDDNKRYFHGFCIRAQHVSGEEGSGQYQLTLAPEAWRLSQRVTHRIYQAMTPPAIILDVLGRIGVQFENRCEGSPDLLEYCVQYGETDLAFVFRLCEEHGLFFFFEHPEECETFVLGDSPWAHQTVPDAVAIPYETGAWPVTSEGVRIRNWAESREPVPRFVSATDYDFTRAAADLFVRLDTGGSAALMNEGLTDELYAFPGGYRAVNAGDRRMQVRAEALEVHRLRINTECNAAMIAVGHRFELTGHSVAGDVDWLVVGAQHSVEVDPNDFAMTDADPAVVQLVPLALPFRMAPNTPRPVIAGVQTAVVVGPQGEEIYTDEHGRVKVQFHWDREGNNDENSSCWLRVMTPWAGSMWGTVAIPRIGQEVVVQFEEGDPDRPLVTGMLFNSTNPPATDLPGAASQMGMRSNTTPGGGGMNEVVMEDRANSQFLRLTAERDYILTAKNDATVSVGFEKAAPGSLSQKVFQDHSEEVEAGNFSQVVKAGNHSVDIQAGSSNTNIASGRTDTVVGTDGLNVDGDRIVTASASYNVTAPEVIITGESTVNMSAPDLTITGESTVSIGNAMINVTGSDITIEGSSSITLTCGGSTIVIDPGGVQITAPIIKNNA